MKKLEASQVAEQLRALPHWTPDALGLAISREFVLADFMHAFAFMTHVAIAAEKHNHHPEWSNVYNRVRITWTTHDVQGLSHNDITMATLCDHAYAGYAATHASS